MRRRTLGQASAETMLVISVVSVSILAAASTLVPLFRTGVDDLGQDVQKILSTGSVGGGGGGGGGGSSSSNSGASSSDVSNTVNEMGSEVDTAGNGDIGSFLG